MHAFSGFSGDVELRPSFGPRPISHAVFDFDGTLSWLRHGWPDLMVDVLRPRLPRLPGESDEAIRDLLLDIVLGLNGKPTIRQMIRFTELAGERGGAPPDAETLRREYQARLDSEIAARTALIRAGRAAPDEFVVHGARRLLEHLRRKGITPVILSSTPEERVKQEAEILGLTPWFGPHIHGGTGDPERFAKIDVFRRILREEGITGDRLLSFGDGPVEIANTKELGGLAIAVCSDEHRNGFGVMDPFKRRQLLDAGADAAIADFRDAPALIDRILEP